MASQTRRQLLTAGGFTVAMLVAGCNGDGTESDPTEGETATETETEPRTETGTETETRTTQPLDIEHVRFLTGQPDGYRQYTQVETTVFEPGDTVWIYFEPTGVRTESADGERRFRLETTLSVTDPDGTTIDTLSDEITRPIGSDESVSELYLFWNVTLPTDAAAGEYTSTITVTDTIDGETADTTVAYSVEGGTAEKDFLELFESSVDEELDVEIQSLDRTDGTVEFVYASDAAYDSETTNEQIGYVAGVYAGLVDSGWETDRLAVEFTDGADDRYSWVVDAQTAQDWRDEEITLDEFLTSVFESLEPADS